jgi:hypothetical protein
VQGCRPQTLVLVSVFQDDNHSFSHSRHLDREKALLLYANVRLLLCLRNKKTKKCKKPTKQEIEFILTILDLWHQAIALIWPNTKVALVSTGGGGRKAKDGSNKVVKMFEQRFVKVERSRRARHANVKCYSTGVHFSPCTTPYPLCFDSIQAQVECVTGDETSGYGLMGLNSFLSDFFGDEHAFQRACDRMESDTRVPYFVQGTLTESILDGIQKAEYDYYRKRGLKMYEERRGMFDPKYNRETRRKWCRKGYKARVAAWNGVPVSELDEQHYDDFHSWLGKLGYKGRVAQWNGVPVNELDEQHFHDFHSWLGKSGYKGQVAAWNGVPVNELDKQHYDDFQSWLGARGFKASIESCLGKPFNKCLPDEISKEMTRRGSMTRKYDVDNMLAKKQYVDALIKNGGPDAAPYICTHCEIFTFGSKDKGKIRRKHTTHKYKRDGDESGK